MSDYDDSNEQLDPQNDRPADEWDHLRTARTDALRALFGKKAHVVYMTPTYFHDGGKAEVLSYADFNGGFAHVTADLTGNDEQVQSSLGNYEIMMCTRGEEAFKKQSLWACTMISFLSRYTTQSRLDPGDTGELLEPPRLKTDPSNADTFPQYEQVMGVWFPAMGRSGTMYSENLGVREDRFEGKDSKIKALLFTTTDISTDEFTVLGRKCGLLLCIGITKPELLFQQELGSKALVSRLRRYGVFPFTDLDRTSVVS